MQGHSFSHLLFSDVGLNFEAYCVFQV
jgi:hypothetical protein